MNQNVNNFVKEVQKLGFFVKMKSVAQEGRVQTAVQVFNPKEQKAVSSLIALSAFEQDDFNATKVYCAMKIA